MIDRWVRDARVVLAATIAAGGLLIMVAVEGWAVPSSIDEAARHPYWSTMLLLTIIVAVWFLAGPAFAGSGKRALPTESAPRSR